MEPERQERIARNEGAFRRVNEAIDAGRGEREDERVAFLCECGALGCNQLLELTIPEYEAVRANARRFILVVGHEQPEVETVVEHHEGYNVVEKLEPTAHIAEETDPRS